jgi:hypothetical protein
MKRALFSFFFLLGCANAATVREARTQPDLGTTVSFAKPCSDHWGAVHDAVRRLRWRIDEEDASARFFVASVPAGGFTWGEHIAVRLQDDGPRCNIHVYSRRVAPFNVTATNWEQAFFDDYPEP